MKNRVYKNIFLLLSVIIFVLGILLDAQNTTSNDMGVIHFQYYEDASGELELKDVEEQSKLGNFIPINKSCSPLEKVLQLTGSEFLWQKKSDIFIRSIYQSIIQRWQG